MYFFSNSPVKCRFTKVVFPTPPSPTIINLNSATGAAYYGKKKCLIRDFIRLYFWRLHDFIIENTYRYNY